MFLLKRLEIVLELWFNGDDVWQGPVSFTSSLVTGMAFLPVYGTSVHTVC